MEANGVVEPRARRRPQSPARAVQRGTTPSASPAQRRAALHGLLTTESGAHPGDVLAARLGVSRQAIVHDVAILRAEGAPIVATVRGYLLTPATGGAAHRAIVAVRHRPEETEAELTALVDHGVRVVDVVVEHPVYGELRAELQLASRSDVDAWAEATRRAGAHLLSELTEGVHLHTLEADDPARLERARAAIGRLGFLLDGGEPSA